MRSIKTELPSLSSNGVPVSPKRSCRTGKNSFSRISPSSAAQVSRAASQLHHLVRSIHVPSMPHSHLREPGRAPVIDKYI